MARRKPKRRPARAPTPKRSKKTTKKREPAVDLAVVQAQDWQSIAQLASLLSSAMRKAQPCVQRVPVSKYRALLERSMAGAEGELEDDDEDEDEGAPPMTPEDRRRLAREIREDELEDDDEGDEDEDDDLLDEDPDDA